MTRSTLSLVCAAALLAACGAGLPEPTARDATVAQTKWPGASLDELHHGRKLYVATCAGCHALKSPDAVPPTQWAKEVAEMRRKRGVTLSDREAELIVHYLFTVGSRVREETKTAAR